MKSPRSRVMHDISRFDALSSRFASYLRQLEHLATECEDYLEVLKEVDTAEAKWVVLKLSQELDKIYKAGTFEKDTLRAAGPLPALNSDV